MVSPATSHLVMTEGTAATNSESGPRPVHVQALPAPYSLSGHAAPPWWMWPVGLPPPRLSRGPAKPRRVPGAERAARKAGQTAEPPSRFQT